MALHPYESNSGATCADIQDRGRGRPQEFASETSSVTGESKSQINRYIARAEALGDDINRVVGTSLDKGVELDALAKMPKPERKEIWEALHPNEIQVAQVGSPEIGYKVPILVSGNLLPETAKEDDRKSARRESL